METRCLGPAAQRRPVGMAAVGSRGAARIAALATAGAMAACSSAAVIRKTDNTVYELHVVRSTDQAVYGVPSGGGPEVRLARAEVADIDHPGNLHAVVGTVLVGILAVPLVDVLSCDRDSCTAWKLVVGGCTLAAGTMGAWGWTVWARSRSRAGGHGPEPGPAVGFDVGARLDAVAGFDRGAAGGVTVERSW